MESPDLDDIAEGVNLGPKSFACAFAGDVTLTENVEDEPAEIASSGESRSSTLQPDISVNKTPTSNMSILDALFHILNVTS